MKTKITQNVYAYLLAAACGLAIAACFFFIVLTLPAYLSGRF